MPLSTLLKNKLWAEFAKLQTMSWQPDKQSATGRNIIFKI
jgi:hypothetical protein